MGAGGRRRYTVRLVTPIAPGRYQTDRQPGDAARYTGQMPRRAAPGRTAGARAIRRVAA
jgi:hypothetical protein